MVLSDDNIKLIENTEKAGIQLVCKVLLEAGTLVPDY